MKITHAYNANVIVKHVETAPDTSGFASVEEGRKDIGEIVYVSEEMWADSPNDPGYDRSTHSDVLKVGTKVAFMPHGTKELDDDTYGKVLCVPITQIVAIVE